MNFIVIIAAREVAIRTSDAKDGEGVVGDFEKGLIYRFLVAGERNS